MDPSRMNEALELLKENPSDPLLLLTIGHFHSQMGQWKEALPYYEKSLAAKPDYIPAYREMGRAFRELGDRERARAAYAKGRAVSTAAKDASAEAEFDQLTQTLGGDA